MKNKNSNHFLILGLFKPSRLVFEGPPEGGERLDASETLARDKAYSLIGAIHLEEHIEGGDDPQIILKDNPFASYLLDLAKDFKDEDLSFASLEHGDGSLLLKYEPTSGKEDFAITDLEYVAIYWLEIKGALDQLFKGKNVSSSLIDLAVIENSKEFNTLILAIAKDRDFKDLKLVEAALAELDVLRPKLNPGGAASRAAAKGRIEAGRETASKTVDLKKSLPLKAPETRVLDSAKFSEAVSKRDPKNDLDLLNINILREGTPTINVEKWDHTNVPGVDQIYNDFRDLGIQVNDPFYQTMFAILRQAANKDSTAGLHNPFLSDDQYRNWFASPLNHKKEIESLKSTNPPFSGSDFLRAFEYLDYIKNKVVLKMDIDQVKTLAKQRELDKDPVAEKVTDVLRSNVDKFRKAIRERDYATAGMYALGVWAIYRSIKELTAGKEGVTVKWIAYGLAAYTGHVFLKNAGYDVLKLAGFRDQDYEVKGTPLEAVDNILKSNPMYRKMAEDIDYPILLKVSEVNLVDLDDLFEKSNTKGIQFIHPTEFPNIFPDLAKKAGFTTGITGGGLNDYTGESNEKLTPSQKEYIRVGKQLYKIALAMRSVYNETLKKDNSNYKGISYRDAIQTDTRKLGKVRHLIGAVQDYAPTHERSLFTEKAKETEARLAAAFNGKDAVLHLDIASGKNGHYAGFIRGFPVVFVDTGNAYRIYLKNQYRGVDAPGTNHVGEVPKEGPHDGVAADTVLRGVEQRMHELLGPFLPGGRALSPMASDYPKFVRGQWVREVELPGASEFGIAASKTEAVLIPHKDGKGITLKVGDKVRIDVNEAIAKQYPVSIALLPKIYSQQEFHALKVLANANQLKIEDATPGDKIVTLLVGGGDTPVNLKYNDTSKKFEFVTATDEKALIQSGNFANEYIKALEGDEYFELNKNIAILTELIGSSAPQNFVAYFFKAIAQETNKSPLDGLNFDLTSGSVPENFASMILNVSKAETMARLSREIAKAENLKDVESARINILQDFNSRIESIIKRLEQENTNLIKGDDSWERDSFMSAIVDQIRSASSESRTYSDSRADFEYLVYKLNLPGITEKSDISKASHESAGKLMGVYVYYTAHLDNHKYKGVDINLDTLTYPPQPTAGISDTKEDPAFRGHYAIRYFEYVKGKIYNKAEAKSDLSVVPDPANRAFWGIKEFDQWLVDEGSYSPLDPLDNKPAFVHDENHPGNKFTELDKYVMGELDKAAAFLMSEYNGILRPAAISDYLRRGAVVNGQVVPLDKIGILTKFPVLDANNQPVMVGSTPKVGCKLWDISNRIYRQSLSGGTPKRSKQVAMTQEIVDQFVIDVFRMKDARGNYLFFKQKPSVSAKLVHKWPWLRHIL